MTKIYEKLDIPEPSADLENRIIAAAHVEKSKKYLFPRLAMLAACMFITISVLKAEPAPMFPKKNMFVDVDFFSEQYGFTGDIS